MSRDCDRTMGPESITCGADGVLMAKDRFLADAIDLSAPFLCGAVLLAGTAWQCHRRGRAIATVITVDGSGS